MPIDASVDVTDAHNAPSDNRLHCRRSVPRQPNGGYQLPPRHDLRNHSPDGLNWGYAGSGPAQLALAVLPDALGSDRRALDHYQAFKRKAIAPLEGDEWEISQEDVLRAVNGDGSRLHTRYREKSGRSPAAYPSGVTSKNQPAEERKRSAFGVHSRGDKTAIELFIAGIRGWEARLVHWLEGGKSA